MYRISAFQPISLSLTNRSTFKIKIRNVDCSLSLQPVHGDVGERFKMGGSNVVLEFSKDIPKGDLVVAAREGLHLIEDFQSALSVVSGVTLRNVRLLQVARIDTSTHECEFLQFFDIDPLHWPRDITSEDLNNARHLLKHWDGLPTGARLRRGARRYRDAIGNVDDDVSAFQDTYAGLEALEPALAPLYGLDPGTETLDGQCAHCKTAYQYKKTSLVGVRAFILDTTDASQAEEGRKHDWKRMNALRHDIVHSLKEDEAIDKSARSALMAGMHYLHDAICVGSHANGLTSLGYKVARGPIKYAAHGFYELQSLPELSEWKSVLLLQDVEWVSHPTHKFVPQTRLRNPGLENLRLRLVYVDGDFSEATMNSLHTAAIERD
ncbi:hypothetical protein [Luteibacter sp. UNCMF366Tsu5.1]|uniref:hypothetical protein n=1 Tax=Luteibacter sp. UNCMF366Tsu5.1 TaxID=1502758 RepID=UPI001160A5EF|nr:hypothetical protein [Luteibacter sp. UNCMF366Tsu5.1]